MMTFRQWIVKYCEERGMFPQQAEAVMQTMIEDRVNEAMSSRWDDDISGYPTSIITVLNMSVSQHARAYIDRECPKAWFRPMFE